MPNLYEGISARNIGWISLPETVIALISEIESHGFEAFLVGGCVRDAILNKDPHDFDICTSATTNDLFEIFCSCDYVQSVLPTGIKYGTVTVMVNGVGYEITTYRVDGAYRDGRHPESVSFSGHLSDDLARRDFTINAMAYNPSVGLVDLHGGFSDIRNGRVRCVGDPNQRFQEDALRILRAIRFASTLRFKIEDATAEAIHRNKGLLYKVSPERKRVELCKFIVGHNVQHFLIAYRDIFAILIPELEPCFDCEQNNPWHCYDVYKHIAIAVSAAPRDVNTRLALLLHDIGKPACKTTDANGVDHFHGHAAVSAKLALNTMDNLRFSCADSLQIETLIFHHDYYIDECDDSKMKASVRRLMAKFDEETLPKFFNVREADVRAQASELIPGRVEKIYKAKALVSEIKQEKPALTVKDLKINGKDLIAMGMQPGPEMGRVLAVLLDAVLGDPSLNERDILLEKAFAMIPFSP